MSLKSCLAIVIISIALIAHVSYAWEGFDYELGAFVEIEPGNLVRSGESIEIFDYGTGNYHMGDVNSVIDTGSSVEINLFDFTYGEYRTLEMDK